MATLRPTRAGPGSFRVRSGCSRSKTKRTPAATPNASHLMRTPYDTSDTDNFGDPALV